MKSLISIVIVLVVLSSCKKKEVETNEPNSVYILSVTASPTASESVTIKNNTASTADISNWTIGDLNNSTAYTIPSGNTLSVGAQVSFSATTMGFQINDSGETIYLKNSAGNNIDTWSN